MEVKNAHFVVSNTDVNKCPNTGLPEYAFIGRSNVGKSSLINMLTGKKSLAMTSATPGKTTLINHFIVDDSWYIVDLPGYGYARLNKEARLSIERIIKGYILKREALTCLFVLIDCRHEPQKIDLDFITFLGEHGVPFALIFTKADKVTKTALVKNIEVYKAKLLETWEALPPIFITSAEKKIGREELLDYIDGINRSLAD